MQNGKEHLRRDISRVSTNNSPMFKLINGIDPQAERHSNSKKSVHTGEDEMLPIYRRNMTKDTWIWSGWLVWYGSTTKRSSNKMVPHPYDLS